MPHPVMNDIDAFKRCRQKRSMVCFAFSSKVSNALGMSWGVTDWNKGKSVKSSKGLGVFMVSNS